MIIYESMNPAALFTRKKCDLKEPNVPESQF